MSLVVGTNSYITVVDADAYFLERYGASSWAVLTEANKTAALITAVPVLESYCVWEGDKTEEDQDLEFPRDGETTVPQDIINAQCEIAFNIVANGGPDIVPAYQLNELKAGSVGLKWNAPIKGVDPIFTTTVKSYLDAYCNSVLSATGGTTRNIRV